MHGYPVGSNARVFASGKIAPRRTVAVVRECIDCSQPIDACVCETAEPRSVVELISQRPK
jgi:hypothetical protein